MKNGVLKFLSIMALAIVFFACDEPEVNPNTKTKFDKNETLERVALRNQMDQLTFNLFSNGIKEGSIFGRQAGKHRFSHVFKNKPSAQRAANEWDTCALVNISENADGTYTVTLDYGQGCVEADSTFISGVVVFTGSETEESGSYEITFEDFYERSLGQNDDDPATLTGSYSGSYLFNNQSEPDYTETFSGTFDISYKSGLQEKWSTEGELVAKEDRFEIRKHNASGSNNKGEQYSSKVTSPLIFDGGCEIAYIYIDGKETYMSNEGSADIDYGDGSCDNILTISTEGVTITIDLDKIDTEG